MISHEGTPRLAPPVFSTMASGRTPNPSLLYGDVVFLYCKTGGYVFSELSRLVMDLLAIVLYMVFLQHYSCFNSGVFGASER